MHEEPRYQPKAPGDFDDEVEGVGIADETTLDSLQLKVGRAFGYLFDFGDDWMHQINVIGIDEQVPTGAYPDMEDME
jgi:hypothetical protein